MEHIWFNHTYSNKLSAKAAVAGMSEPSGTIGLKENKQQNFAVLLLLQEVMMYTNASIYGDALTLC